MAKGPSSRGLYRAATCLIPDVAVSHARAHLWRGICAHRDPIA